MEKNKLDRINELARKNKEQGLTDEELKERDILRKEYLASFREGARQTLESVMIQEDDGTLTPLKKRNKTDKASHNHNHNHIHLHAEHDHDCHCGCDDNHKNDSEDNLKDLKYRLEHIIQ